MPSPLARTLGERIYETGREKKKGRAEAGERRGEVRKATQTEAQSVKEKIVWVGKSMVPAQDSASLLLSFGTEAPRAGRRGP